jgi:hypothetical protein
MWSSNIKGGGTCSYSPCGGPAKRRRRWKGNPVPKGITGPPCLLGTELLRIGRPAWGLNTRLLTLLCKKNYIAKSKEVKTGWSTSRRNRQVCQNLQRRLWLKECCFAKGDDDIIFTSVPQKNKELKISKWSVRILTVTWIKWPQCRHEQPAHWQPCFSVFGNLEPDLVKVVAFFSDWGRIGDGLSLATCNMKSYELAGDQQLQRVTLPLASSQWAR